jgi:hypothetical protein
MLKKVDLINGKQTRILVSDLASGIYLLCDGQGGALKFIKQ